MNSKDKMDKKGKQSEVEAEVEKKAETGKNNTIQDSQNAVAACKKENEQLKDQYLRVKADFENFKRRMEKDQVQWFKNAQAQVFSDLLEVIDNFDRAFEQKENMEKTDDLKGWLQGFELIHKSLQNLLKKYEVQEVTEMTDFNPELHEALVQVESSDHKTGQIVDVMNKGYRFKGQLIRPAKVTVAK